MAEDKTKNILVYADIHTKLKERAEKERLTLVDYTSKVIAECLERIEFLERVAPSISVLQSQSEPDKIHMMDTQDRKLVTVAVRDGKIFCETCETDDCKHVHFVMIYPDLRALMKEVNSL